ncbi:unnamed protein product, partial [Polarella glacialis]
YQVLDRWGFRDAVAASPAALETRGFLEVSSGHLWGRGTNLSKPAPAFVLSPASPDGSSVSGAGAPAGGAAAALQALPLMFGLGGAASVDTP